MHTGFEHFIRAMEIDDGVGRTVVQRRCDLMVGIFPLLMSTMVLAHALTAAALCAGPAGWAALMAWPVSVAAWWVVLWLRAKGVSPNVWMVIGPGVVPLAVGYLTGAGALLASHVWLLVLALVAPVLTGGLARWSSPRLAAGCLVAVIVVEALPLGGDPLLAGVSAAQVGQLRWLALAGGGGLILVTLMMSDLILSELASQSERQARTDFLTGLPNRRHFDEAMAAAQARAARVERGLCLAVVDIDHFKAVNDRFGHSAGDLVLREVAERLNFTRRQGDLLARVGGEEFALVMECTNLDEAKAAAERLRKNVSQWEVKVSSDQGLYLSVSIGLAFWWRGASASQLLAEADRALYAAKNAGRNQVCLAGDRNAA